MAKRCLRAAAQSQKVMKRAKRSEPHILSMQSSRCVSKLCVFFLWRGMSILMNSLAMKALWRQSAPQSRQKSFYFLSRRVFPSNPSSLSRFFSASSTVPSADPSFFSKYKKYFMISSPALLALLFHAGLFNSTQFRYFIESNFLPDYVDYLRQQYGYDDEDPVERARIASINQQIAQKVTVRLTFRDGTVSRFEDVSGDLSLFDFLNGLSSEVGVESIDFEDPASHSGDSPSPAPHTIHPSHLTSSLWEPYEESAPLPSNPYLVDLSQEFILSRYQNIISSFLRDLRQTGHIPQQSGEHSSSFSRSQGEAKQVIPVYDQKQAARETIKRLEQLLESYEAEMKHGTREIDAIQEDIQRTKGEIVTLQRKHLNTFYFF